MTPGITFYRRPPTGTTLHIKRPCEPHCRIIAIGAGGNDVVPQHQVHRIRLGDQHALVAGQPARHAQIEETLDLLVDAADGLDLTGLADRAGEMVLYTRINHAFRQLKHYMAERKTWLMRV